MLLSKINIVIISILLLCFQINAQPIVSLSKTGPCTGDTLLVTSNLPDSQIIWKRNGIAVDTEKKHLLTYATTVGVDTLAFDACVDTNGNVYATMIYSYTCTTLICRPVYRIEKYTPGSIIGTIIIDTTSDTDYIGNIFVDNGDTLYYTNFDGVTKLPPGASIGTYVAGGHNTGSAANQLFYPGGMFIDKNRNIYVADKNNHRVQKWSPGATSGITVAGGHGLGFNPNQLNYPHGVFVDDSGNVYVADYGNNRIQKWGPGALSGATVAGDHWGNPGFYQWELNGPEAVHIDANRNVIIADRKNNRIQKWAPGATTGTTLFGGNGQGNGPDQLYFPSSIRQDKHGNYYVADDSNGRIQKFTDTVLPFYVPGIGGNYTAVVTATGSGGSTTTSVDTILDYGFPNVTISTLYNNVICIEYDTAIVHAAANNGGSAPSFDWYKNNSYINTTSDSNTVIPGIVDGDKIMCLITSNFACLYPPNFATSNEVTMTVDTNMLSQSAGITVSPGNNIHYGQNVTFKVHSINGGIAYQWYKNSNIISGATDSIYSNSTLIDGDEITCVSESGLPCVWNKSVVSNVIVMNVALTVGKQNGTVEELSIYPNPNSGTFSISGSAPDQSADNEVLIELVDIMGKVLQSEKTPAQHGTFNKQISIAPGLGSGIYLLRVSSAETSITLRFVISR